MSAEPNGFWDFRSYDEKTWFRDLVYLISFLALLYVGLHWALSGENYNYQYNKLSPDQSLFVTRICTGAQPASAGVAGAAQQNPPPDKLPQAAVEQIMVYLGHIFDGPIEKKQYDTVRDFISKAKRQDAADYLSKNLFKVRSYFWLVGPAVYWEVIFCALFGVLCNLLFVLGAVGSNATTDLTNPATEFDSSEISGQVAKIIYAPICTLFVVLGYSLVAGQNVVDINLGKGLLIFGFVGGYYSSRVLAFMDRLRDLLLPNSGTAALSANNQTTLIQQVKVKLSLDPSVPGNVASVVATIGFEDAIVKMALSGTSNQISGIHSNTDPDGTFIFTAVMSGNYTISASLLVPMDNASPPSGNALSVTLNGTVSGGVQSGIAPIPLALKIL